MLTSLADSRHSFEFGEEVDASPAEAQSWVAAGIAEYVGNSEPSTPERGLRRPETRHRTRSR